MIHKYKLKGYDIVLDVNSGGVHIVDDLTFDLLDYVQPPFDAECPAEAMDKLSEKYSPEDIKECYEEIPLSRGKHAEMKEQLEKYGIKFV